VHQILAVVCKIVQEEMGRLPVSGKEARTACGTKSAMRYFELRYSYEKSPINYNPKLEDII
jgi:hypothetical protein